MSKCIHGVSLRHSCDQCLNLNRPGVGSELYRLECERDTLRTANQRLEGEVARLREALGTAMNSMLDSGYSSKSVVIQLCRAALSTNGEVTE
jgi:hypothetical protein